MIIITVRPLCSTGEAFLRDASKIPKNGAQCRRDSDEVDLAEKPSLVGIVQTKFLSIPNELPNIAARDWPTFFILTFMMPIIMCI